MALNGLAELTCSTPFGIWYIITLIGKRLFLLDFFAFCASTPLWHLTLGMKDSCHLSGSRLTPEYARGFSSFRYPSPP